MLKNLFRKKSIELILKDAERRRTDGTGAVRSRRARCALGTSPRLGSPSIIGSGIFRTIGQAAYSGGPAVSLLFVFVAVACGFTAFCYAEFASMIPISGSAYTYAYASFGELIAWIIGWDLLLEYAIGNIAIAISWSDYFTGFLAGLGFNIPDYMTMDFLTAWRGYHAVAALQATEEQWRRFLRITRNLKMPTTRGGARPSGPIHFVADVPALRITASVTTLVYVGIKESRNANNIMVAVKLLVILAVIAIGSFTSTHITGLRSCPTD